MMAKKKCKCGAEIDFKKAKSSWMPVEITPVPYVQEENGKYTILTLEGEIVKGTIAKQSEINRPKYGYIPHWTNCPMHGQYRK